MFKKSRASEKIPVDHAHLLSRSLLHCFALTECCPTWPADSLLAHYKMVGRNINILREHAYAFGIGTIQLIWRGFIVLSIYNLSYSKDFLRIAISPA